MLLFFCGDHRLFRYCARTARENLQWRFPQVRLRLRQRSRKGLSDIPGRLGRGTCPPGGCDLSRPPPAGRARPVRGPHGRGRVPLGREARNDGCALVRTGKSRPPPVASPPPTPTASATPSRIPRRGPEGHRQPQRGVARAQTLGREKFPGQRLAGMGRFQSLLFKHGTLRPLLPSARQLHSATPLLTGPFPAPAPRYLSPLTGAPHATRRPLPVHRRHLPDP
jgi:hypothetical protein